ncbi:hypothetical protein MASR2M29_04150 [Spirochaetota bacterium]
MYFYLSLRTLYEQKRRYAVIALAILLGSALITILSGLAYGAMDTVKSKAARYFAGQLSITGYTKGDQLLSQKDEVIKSLKASGLPLATIAPRTVNYGDANLFFGGEMIVQRRLIGIEFEQEYKELSSMHFSEGSLDSMLGDSGKKGILISLDVARLLKARVGDEISIFLSADSGQYNTATFTLKGIFEETSLFAYVSYLRNEDLNELLVRDKDSASDIAIYGKRGTNYKKLTEAVRTYLSHSFNVFPPLLNAEALGNAVYRSNYEGEYLAVQSLDAKLASIKNLLDAFLILTYFVLAVFTVIVMVGVLNTYRVIVYERTKEIGTLRALGLGKNGVVMLLAAEAMILGIASGTIGYFCGLLGLGALGYLDLSQFPATGFFTEQGRLALYINFRHALVNLAIMSSVVVMAALGPAIKAGRISPAEAMRDVG